MEDFNHSITMLFSLPQAVKTIVVVSVQIEKNSSRRNSEVHTKRIRRFSINRYINFILKLCWQASFFHAISSVKLFCQTKFEDGAGSSHPGKIISCVMIKATANIFP